MDLAKRKVELIARYAVAEGVTETPIEGLRLFRMSTPVPRTAGVYEPSVCAVVQGRKVAYVNGAAHHYDETQLLFCGSHIPVSAELVDVSADRPALGFMLSLDTRVARETLVLAEPARDPGVAPAGPGAAAFVVTRWTRRLEVETVRLLELLDDPIALQALWPSRLRELVYALASGENPLIQGSLRAVRDMVPAVSYLRENYHLQISMDELAARLAVSRAVFFRRFKGVTGVSPLQFQKSIRLNNAAQLLRQGTPVSEVADQVGYASKSQFSREFRKRYGIAPGQWARAEA